MDGGKERRGGRGRDGEREERELRWNLLKLAQLPEVGGALHTGIDS